jgi:D-threo-aldose 1-dehydrogenase
MASPISFLDTAALYGDGEAERRIGAVLREQGGLPEGYVLQTKAGLDEVSGAFDGESITRRFARSLHLLGLEHVPIVFLHDPEHITFGEATAPGGPLSVLQHLKEEGVVDYLGLSGGPIDLLIRYLDLGVFDVVITHNRYTLLEQSAIPLLDGAAQRGVPVINAAPYGGGILAKGADQHPYYMYQEAPPAMLTRARAIEAMCQHYAVPLAAVALQFSLREPRITSTIVGISSPEEVAQTLALATWSIPAALWTEIAGLE